MRLIPSPRFRKSLRRLDRRTQERVRGKLKLFLQNKCHPSLRYKTVQALKHEDPPVKEISIQHIINAAPLMTVDESERWQDKFSYLLALIADCDIDRPRRHCINPRVVKVKMSKFKRKNRTHKSEKRNLEQELKIVWGFPGSAMAAEGVPA